MPQSTFTPNAPKTTNWPALILSGIGVLIVVGLLFVVVSNKDVSQGGISKKEINSERSLSILDSLLGNDEENISGSVNNGNATVVENGNTSFNSSNVVGASGVRGLPDLSALIAICANWVAVHVSDNVPVCGINAVTYPNLCVARLDGLDSFTGVGRYTTGACPAGAVDNAPPVIIGRFPPQADYGVSDIITDGSLGAGIHIYTDEPAACRIAEGTKSFNQMQSAQSDIAHPTGYATDSFFNMPLRVGQTVQYTVLCEDRSGNRMVIPFSFSLRHNWEAPVCLGENVWAGAFSLSDFRVPPVEVKENLLPAISSDEWVITRNGVDYAVPYGYASLGVNTLSLSRYGASAPGAVMFLAPSDIISLQYRGNRSNESLYVNGVLVQRAPYQYPLQNPIAPGGVGPPTAVGVNTQTFLSGDPASHNGGVWMTIEEAGWPSVLGADKLSTIPAYIPKVKILSPLANSNVPGAATTVRVNASPADAIYSVELFEVKYNSGGGGHSRRSLGKLTHPLPGTTIYEWSWTPSTVSSDDAPSPFVVLEADAGNRYGANYNT